MKESLKQTNKPNLLKTKVYTELCIVSLTFLHLFFPSRGFSGVMKLTLHVALSYFSFPFL